MHSWDIDDEFLPDHFVEMMKWSILGTLNTDNIDMFIDVYCGRTGVKIPPVESVMTLIKDLEKLEKYEVCAVLRDKYLVNK